MVQAHHDSRKEGTTKPIPPQKTEKIWHGSSDPQKVLQLHHREHPLVASPPGMACSHACAVRLFYYVSMKSGAVFFFFVLSVIVLFVLFSFLIIVPKLYV